MSKHTPGPWIADSVNTQDDAVTAVWQNDGRSDYYLRTSQVCECFWDSGEDLDIGDNRPVSLAEAEANAKLIAAAPELLEALQFLTGPTDDPVIGWRGSQPSANNIFACEFCGAEHLDCTLILHADDCFITRARAAIAKATT
jgi:hypothetical protein